MLLTRAAQRVSVRILCLPHAAQRVSVRRVLLTRAAQRVSVRRVILTHAAQRVSVRRVLLTHAAQRVSVRRVLLTHAVQRVFPFYHWMLEGDHRVNVQPESSRTSSFTFFLSYFHVFLPPPALCVCLCSNADLRSSSSPPTPFFLHLPPRVPFWSRLRPTALHSSVFLPPPCAQVSYVRGCFHDLCLPELLLTRVSQLDQHAPVVYTSLPCVDLHHGTKAMGLALL